MGTGLIVATDWEGPSFVLTSRQSATLAAVPRAFPFDAVLFDLDGTLVATDRFWPDAAREGALTAFAELGLERTPPTQPEWMDLVGKPLEEGFDALFHDLAPEPRRHVMRRCVEAEHRLLDEGRAGALPGVFEALAELRAAGVRTGIASNCSQSYLDVMMDELGLKEWIEEGRCLDTPGIANKADMIEDLLLAFGTRRAAFVGDREGDRDAAWANGVPHVHLARGYAAVGETVAAEAVIEGMDELVPRLRRRQQWVADLCQRFAPEPGRPLGITGGPASGKTLLAQELAAETGWSELQPGATPAPDVLAVVEAEGLPGDGLAALVELIVPEQLAWRRLLGRDVRLGGDRDAARVRLEAHRARERDPSAIPIDASNALGPLPGASTGD